MSKAPRRVRIHRELHPVAWWIWAIGLATAASCTSNPLLLASLMAVAWLVVISCRSDGFWSRSFKLYLWLALIVIVVRILFRILLGGVDEGHILFELPEIPLPDWAAGIRLFGAVSRESLLAGLYDGMRLAALLIAVGAANALANPKRLMKSLPPALYEIGTAMVVAISVIPQLADSASRVKAAQDLRGGPPGRVRGLRRLLVPILEDAFERSLSLAAGMDTRGYGRTAGASPAQRRVTGALMLIGLIGVCIGVYAFLDLTAPRWLAGPMLAGGVLVALLGFMVAGRRVGRSRYRPDRWRAAELLVAGSGVATGAIGWSVAHWEPTIAYPAVTTMPEVSLLALTGLLIAVVPLFAAPPPLTAAGRERRAELERVALDEPERDVEQYRVSAPAVSDLHPERSRS
ncbi:energy-coupling factor transporter transmembrane component T family protein [Nocardioides sp. Bht2]|uniref:energy-coupling factor transporter transmembrane component T family protein n=1 Tax=Nocardioides sp. Bht2 TaxID=3392297 RepID=UPI0039B375F0